MAKNIRSTCQGVRKVGVRLVTFVDSKMSRSQIVFGHTFARILMCAIIKFGSYYYSVYRFTTQAPIAELYIAYLPHICA